VLVAVAHHAERRVDDPAIAVDAQRGGEEERSVARVPVEEVAIVEVAVAGGGMRERLGRLVDRMVVERMQQGSASRDFFEQ
jgi:hypothetical protein